MSDDLSLRSDLSDLLGQYFDRRPIQAVQITSPDVLARIGRWVTANGGHCTWAAAHGWAATKYAGAASNRLVIHRTMGTNRDSGTIGDWVVRDHAGEFHIVSSDEFAAVYEPVITGEIQE